ncbi:ABC transporter ATP-binding protein [Pseudomonas synxantha]|nr:ABC transporter ATP-binding protein [Pseudomonas synxantha]
MLLKNAPILVVDESASSLDSISGCFIKDKLDEIMEGEAVLWWRTGCHRILVFDKSRVVEDGSHGQLLRQSGAVSGLWRRQLSSELSEAV